MESNQRNKHLDFDKRVDVLYDHNQSNKLAFAERVHVLYSRENTPNSSKYANGFIDHSQESYTRFEYRDPSEFEKTINNFDCLLHLMTACGLLMILFAILVPICTIVLAAYQGFHGLLVPGFLALIFVGVIICVFLARSRSRRINRLSLFISMAVFSALSILISFSLFIVEIIALNRDSPAPYGIGIGINPNLMEILAMECVNVSSAVIAFIASCTLFGISIHFARGVHKYNGAVSRSPTPDQKRHDIPMRPLETVPEVAVVAPVKTMTPVQDVENTIQRAKTAPRTAKGQRPNGPSNSASDASVNQIDIDDPDDVLELPDTPSRYKSTRRWGKTKNVLRALMDLKQ